MPHAVTSDHVRLYFEEAGQGTPIIFLHEFAADHTNWEPQMRYFSRGHRCIAYSARGYTPSDVPASAEAYTYKHFYTDALAVLDHLKIAKAHFVGLSMGSYSSLQIGLNAPERALSMTLAAVLSYGLGTLVRGWAPPRLWIVPLVWLAAVVLGALLGFLLSNARQLTGLVGVLGPFLFASVGFAVGLLGGAGSGRSTAS